MRVRVTGIWVRVRVTVTGVRLGLQAYGLSLGLQSEVRVAERSSLFFQIFHFCQNETKMDTLEKIWHQILASLKKLKTHEFNFSQTLTSSKNMDLISCKL